MKKYFSVLILALLISLALAPLAAVADDAELKLRVFPLNCVFEYVNDGSNKILYMTPKECGLHLGRDKSHNKPGTDSGLQDQDSGDTQSVDWPVLQGSGDPNGVGFLDDPESLDGPPNILPRDDAAYQKVASHGSWAKPLVAGAVVMTAAAAVDAAFFGFSAAKFTAATAYQGAGSIRRLIRLILKL